MSSSWCCVCSVVYTTRVQVSEITQLFKETLVKVPICRVSEMEKDYESLFIGYQNKWDATGFSSRRYRDEVQRVQDPDDAGPQMRFPRESWSTTRNLQNMNAELR